MTTLGTTQASTSMTSRDEANCDVEMFVMANCSKLLSARDAMRTDTTASSIRVFECKICDRKFDSFQALGGHRASHKRPKLELSMMTSGAEDHMMKPSKMYECSVCGLKFLIGQALGGHMRRHPKEGLSSSSISSKKRTTKMAVQAVTNEADGTVDLNLITIENHVNNSGNNMNNKFTTQPLYTHEFFF